MPGIDLQQDGARIDAAVLARAFGISADDLRQGMRDGTITSRFERGAGKDAGTVRLIFFSSSRRIRITADASGRICQRRCNIRPRGGVKSGHAAVTGAMARALTR